ncbi:aminodeoxychorismate lyase [Colwelliaceae bacterium BS250]
MLYNSVNFKSIATVASSDRGIAFGDGVFTTAKIVHATIEHQAQHLLRLQHSCQRLSIQFIDWQAVSDEMNKAAENIELGCLKVIITAGSNGRGYSRIGATEPTIIVSVSDYPSHYQQWQKQGVRLGQSSIKLGLNPALAGLKHLNRLEQVLVRNELDTLAVDEVIVSDLNDNIIECNTANIFWCKKDIWFTPSLTMAGVNGIIRDNIIDALANVNIVEAKISELVSSDAMFICNSLLGVAPVQQFLHSKISIEKVLQHSVLKGFQ